jgi:phosphocarrier protein
MKELKYVITDELGLHARPAGQFVKLASSFKSSIKLGTPARMVDAKSILGIMSLALKQGSEISATIEGPDEDEAFEKLTAFLKENL